MVENSDWCYKGFVKRGTTILNGKGICIKTKVGHLIEGWFENDKVDGPARYYWATGDMYEGPYKDDKRHGKAKFYKKDGTVVDETWENGVEK